MAYHSARNVSVLFGGHDSHGFDDETWEWDGTNWKRRATTGPSQRRHHAMAYDSARGVTVLFGGQLNDTDTWEWDGTAWSLRAETGPISREGHAMAFDSVRGVTVLFGGNNGDDETWEWDGTAWTFRTDTGPSDRMNHAMSFDSARGVVVLFGGFFNLSSYGDTWEWDGTTWTLRSTTGPSPRELHELTYDAARGVHVLFGGYSLGSHTYYGDTWEWDGQTWTPRGDTGPAPRHSHASAYDSARKVHVLFGGLAEDTRYDDTWEYHPPCSGRERVKTVACNLRDGTNQLKVSLSNGLEGDSFTVRLTDGSTKSGTINSRGKGKAKFNNRPAGDTGTATAEWGCGAEDSRAYECVFEVSDTCESAIELNLPTTRAGSTRNATIDEGFPACGQGTEVIAPGVWYKVMGTGQWIEADTCTDANFNTKINVYEGSCAAPICVVGNNNICGDRSAVVWPSAADVEYLILVHGTLDEVGEFVLSVREADDVLDCQRIAALDLACDSGNETLTATLFTSHPEGALIDLTLNDTIGQQARVGNRGIAVAVFQNIAPGEYKVCVDGCAEICESVSCP